MSATWALQSPAHGGGRGGGGGALAVIQVAASSAGELEDALRAAGVEPVAVGEARVRNLAGIDLGVAARWSEAAIHLMPHGGAAVLRRLCARLTERGLAEATSDPVIDYPEAEDEIEAHMLAALARAASPVAIDLLLDQPRRWRELGIRRIAEARLDAAGEDRSSLLRRLLDPPLVAAIGPANIGKSSLANALAGRAVAIVSDEPGTTRDHIGVMIDMGGLVVRYIDTPGLRADAPETEQQGREIAREMTMRADLVLLCGDATVPPPFLSSSPARSPAGREEWIRPEDWIRHDAATMTVALRSDLGLPGWPHDVAVSIVPHSRSPASRRSGLTELVTMIRDRLTPAWALAAPGPWKFWG